jgi:adenine/guanine/hypoxanthine permease
MLINPFENSKDYPQYQSISMTDQIRHSQDMSLDSTLNQPLTLRTSEVNPPWEEELRKQHLDDDQIYQGQSSSNLKALTEMEFYKQENWFEQMCEILFKLERRKTTIKAEVYYGVIHFISCLYVLAVVPQQLAGAGYNGQNTVVAVGLCTGVATIFCGLFANLPFVLAPPTVVSIFLSVFLQQNNLNQKSGNIAVILSGAILILFGWRPLGRLAARLIPLPIQAGTAIGIGLLTALAGSTEVNLVVKGQYAILKMGFITPEICIALSGIVIISVCIYYHIKGSFCLAVVICSLIWWIYDRDFPHSIAAIPSLSTASFEDVHFTSDILLLTSDLIFLYVLYLNGLMTSLANLAALTRDDSTIPRGRWIFIMCGIFTVIAGLLSSAPILVSPESSASIKEGAKTGLSAVVCGVLFLLAVFLAPLFHRTPATGTSPVLIMIGIILFQNCSRIDWRNISKAAPAFVVLFYIPFTYSVIQGKYNHNPYMYLSLNMIFYYYY